MMLHIHNCQNELQLGNYTPFHWVVQVLESYHDNRSYCTKKNTCDVNSFVN